VDLQLGLVPVVDDGSTRLALDRIASSLARSTGRACTVHRSRSPAQLCAAVDRGEANLVWSSPTAALSQPALLGLVPVVTCVRQGVAHYHGVVFVDRRSSYFSLLDLKGARAAWVAPTSAAGYIFPRVALAGNGLDPTALFAEERFCETHGAVVFEVLDGALDVGATFAVFEGGDATKPLVRAGFVDLGREDDVRVLLATPPIPSDFFAAAPALDRELGPLLARALHDVCDELPDEFHQVFGADGLIDADRRHLAELRRQLDDARAMGVLE